MTVEGCKPEDGECDWKGMEAKALKEAQQKANDIAVKTAEERAKNLARRAAQRRGMLCDVIQRLLVSDVVHRWKAKAIVQGR